jgi:hypothetical protein
MNGADIEMRVQLI